MPASPRRPAVRSKNAVRAVAEALEQRRLLSTIDFNWIGGTGSWHNPANWSHVPPPAPEPDRPLPSVEDNVTIPPGAFTVTIGGGQSAAAKTITSGANLRLEGASTLFLGGDVSMLNSSTFTLAGGLNTRLHFFNPSSTQAKTFRIGGDGTFLGAAGGGFVLPLGGTPSDRLEIATTVRVAGGSTIQFATPNFTNFGTLVSDVAGGSITLSGSTASPSIVNRGTIRAVNGGTVELGFGVGHTWNNGGLIEINGGILRLNGTFRQSNLGNYTRVGGEIRITGTMRGNLALDDQSGSWIVDAGTLIGSRITRTGNQSFTFGNTGVLDGCTLGLDATVTGFQAAQIRNGLTLENGAALRLNNGGTLNVNGTQTIGGNGQVLFTGTHGNINILLPAPHTLTIDSGVVLRTDNTAGGTISGQTNDKLIVKGQFAATGSNAGVTVVPAIDLFGQMTVGNGATLSLFGALALDAGGSMAVGATSLVSASQNITGGTTTSSRKRSGGILSLAGGTVAVPRLLEVMSQDRGAVTDGYKDNFALGRLTIAGGSKVKLQDGSNNAPGAEAEAVYVDTLVVENSATLDLNGKKVYARGVSIQGTGAVTGGTVTPLSDGGPILLGLPTTGRILVSNEQDEWTFFGRAGQTISAIMNPGQTFSSPGAPLALAPAVGPARMTMLKPDGTVLGTVQGSSNAFSLSDQVLPVDGIYKLRVQGQASNNIGFYVLAIYDVTVETRSYTLNTIASGNIETPFVRDKWTFSLEAGQQIQFDLLAAETSGLQFTLEGPGGFVAFNNVTDDTALITIPGGRGGNYALTVKGATDQVGGYSFVVRDGSITPLTLGVPFAGTLPGSGSPRWFSMNLPNPGQLLVALNDSTNADRNRLYLRQGALPTQSEFDFRSTAATADQSIYVPTAQAGEWFVLVYGDFVPAASSYTLRAEYSDLRISSITPDRYGVNNTMTMTLSGGGYGPGTTVKLTAGATTINAGSVEIDSFTQITATFNLAGAAQLTFDVTVQNGAASFTLPGAFRTLANQPAKLEMKLNMPAVPTRTSVSAFSVEYANTGNVAMPAPLIIVQSADPEGDDHPVLSLDMTRVFQTFWATKLPPGVGERVMMLGSGAVPGVLNPGERMSIPINYLGQKPPIETTDNRLQLEMKCVEADEPSSQDPIDWEGLKNALKPPSVPSPIWDQAYANLTAPLTSIEHYAQMLRDAAAYLGRLGVRVVDVDDLWNFEVHKALGSFTAFPTLAAAVDAQVPGPGTSLSLTRRFVDGVIGRNIEGPFGFGWTVPWLTTLTRGADDEVITLTAGAARRVFVRDGRGLPSTATYFSEAGDSSTLKRLSSGAFDLRETGGTLTRFGADGKINFVQDLNANRVTAGYDGAGRLNALTHGSGGSIAVTYNAAGRISRVSDSLGHSVTYAYDASNDHLMSATSDDGTQLSYTYDGANSNVMKRHALLSEQMDGSTQFYSYNDAGRISSTSRTGGAQQTNVTYEQGQVTLADAAGASKVFFDHRVRVAKVTDARGFSSVMRYDKDDRLASTTMPDGSQHKYEFCDCGSLTGSTDALGRSARYTRDPITRKVTSITDTEGNVSRYTYDTAGNQVSLIHADGSVETASNFTASGLAQTFTNRRGSATTFVYDALGRVTKQTSPNSTAADYVYDARGRLATITSGTSVTSLSYDTAVDGDRLKRVTYPGGKFVEFDYDGTGRRTAVRDQDGFTTRYDYDAAGRVHHVRDTGGAALATYTYDGAGRLSRIDNGNNTFAVYGYDAAGNVLSIENFRAAGVLNSSFTYTYDSRGRRTTAATSDGTWTYGYDANGQLTAATFASTGSVPNQNIQITYDAAGNREFATINGELIDYGSNALNQVTSVDGVAFQYDADGNLTSDGTRAFTYDALGRLTQITAGADVQQFEYNAFGARSASILNGVRTNYLVMPDVFGEVLAEYDASGNVVARNVFNGTLIGRTSGGAAAALNYFDYDVTSSTAGVSDATGAYVNRYLYDPFGGSLLSNESIANPYEFNGAYGVRGEIGGLSQMGFRDYSASLGRFTTVDPLRFDADLNTYRFADNSPTMKLDPTGLFALAGFPGKPNWGANAFYGTGVDGGQSIAIAAQTGAWPSTVDAIAGVATSFGVNAAFSANGLNGFASGIQVWLDPKVNGHHVDAICGLNLQREFGTINKSAARQMAAIQKELGGRGAGGGSGGANCYGNDESRDADMGIGDRCGYGEAGLVHAFDPNDKLAPVGFGPDNRVAIESPVAYTIDFENIGPGSVDDQGNPFPIVATAPAQRVFITDQLSSHLDFGTVRFTEFSFGETIIPVADGFGAVNASLPMSLNGATFEVLIAADIDVATGLLSVVLQAVDPVTGLPPAGLVGLLPPEDGTGNGMGYVKFAVRPRADVADGTPIRNIAHIRFDANDVIPTNQVNPLDPTQGTDPAREALVTIDALAPTVIAGPTFDFDAASPRLTLRFSEDVRDSLSVGSATITDLTHGGTIAPVGFNYDTLTNTATFDLGAALDGANYHLLLPSANVADGVGHHAAGDITLDFFHLPGDANHDGRVNLADFNILAANFGQSNRTFSQGDFNYDTVVNLSDFNILAGRFGQALAPHADGSRAPDDARTETELRKLLDEIT